MINNNKCSRNPRLDSISNKLTNSFSKKMELKQMNIMIISLPRRWDLNLINYWEIDLPNIIQIIKIRMVWNYHLKLKYHNRQRIFQ